MGEMSLAVAVWLAVGAASVSVAYALGRAIEGSATRPREEIDDWTLKETHWVLREGPFGPRWCGTRTYVRDAVEHPDIDFKGDEAAASG